MYYLFANSFNYFCTFSGLPVRVWIRLLPKSFSFLSRPLLSIVELGCIRFVDVLHIRPGISRFNHFKVDIASVEKNIADNPAETVSCKTRDASLSSASGPYSWFFSGESMPLMRTGTKPVLRYFESRGYRFRSSGTT